MDNEGLSCTTAFWVEQAQITTCWLMRLYHLGKRYHSKLTFLERRTKETARIWRICAKLSLQQNTLRSYKHEELPCAVIMQGIMCNVYMQFHKHTGRPVKAQQFQRQKDSPYCQRVFLWIQPGTLQCLLLFSMLFSTYNRKPNQEIKKLMKDWTISAEWGDTVSYSYWRPN